MKFIIGTLRFRPGTRDELLEIAQPMIEDVRREEGCLFFELNPKHDAPDDAFLCECFVDDAAHRLHKTLPHFRALVAELESRMTDGDVKVHFADAVFDDD